MVLPEEMDPDRVIDQLLDVGCVTVAVTIPHSE
jgi:hypothetical protein